MPAPMASEPRSNRNSLMAPSSLLSILDGPLSDNGRNWTPIAIEAGCVVWVIRHLRRYLFSAFFLMYANLECLQQIRKIGGSKSCIQRWMEFLSDYNYRLSYQRGRENANANFLCRLPLPPTVESSTLSDPDDLGVYVVRACDDIAPPCPIPGVGLGGLAPSSSLPHDELFPKPAIPVLGGLPLTNDDRSHHPPFRGFYRRTTFVLRN